MFTPKYGNPRGFFLRSPISAGWLVGLFGLARLGVDFLRSLAVVISHKTLLTPPLTLKAASPSPS